MDSRKSKFILNAILDTQATIRAIDVKIGYLLAALLVPFALLGRIWAHLSNIHSILTNYHIGDILAGTFLLLWIFSILCFIRALSAIDNPTDHINNSHRYKGIFYSGGLYKFGFLDSFLNRNFIKAHDEVPTFLSKIPNNTAEVLHELTLEQMKLIYIREIKLHRLKIGITAATFWFLFGFASFTSSKLYLTDVISHKNNNQEVQVQEVQKITKTPTAHHRKHKNSYCPSSKT